MANKEIRIPHSKIQDPQTITDVVRNEFRKNDLDIHQHEVDELTDDHRTGERILSIRKKQYFAGMGIGEKTQPGRYIYNPKTREFDKQ